MATALAEPIDAGRERLWSVWAEERARIFTPPPVLTVSQWADKHRIVPSYSAEPGHWVTDKTPYLREVMDSFNDPTVTKVVFMKCARIGATEAGLNVIGYFIDQDPSPVFIVQPTVDDAKDFSKEQLTPTIEETDCLRDRISSAASRDSGNTIQAKVFPGGALYLVGANSPRGFRRRTARVIVLEEVDGYPLSAGTEGDQVKLAERRATTFQHRRKVYINSTPTLKGMSRIEAEFELSDQRRYFVPCPDCGHEQTLKWAGIKWDDGKPSTAAYCCEGCGVLIAEREKFGMVQRGRWQPTNPGPSIVGFHMNALYSPWVTWSELVEEWLAAQGKPEKLQVFINTVLGESWEDRGGGLDPDSFFANRREAYAAEVPEAVSVLTAGVDVQHDRIEVVVRGWAQAEESYFIERVVLMGDPSADDIWRDLDRVLLEREYTHESGATMRVYAAAIDSGDQQERVMRYCAPRYRRRIFCVKGAANPASPFLPKRPTRNNKHRCPLFLLGVNQAKSLVYGRLKIQGVSLADPCAYRYRWNTSADRDYFEQLTAEKAERKYLNRLWVMVYTCPAHRRNEVLDCEVYALAALYLSNVARERLGAEVHGIVQQAAPAGVPEQAPAESSGIQHPPALPRRPQRRGFITGWK